MFQWYLFNTLFSDIFNGLFLFFCRSQVNGSQGGWCWRFVHIAHLMIEWRNSRFNSYIVDASILGYNWKMMRPRHQRKTISFVFLCPRLLSVSQVKAICSAKIFDCFEHKLTPFPTSCCLYQSDFAPRIKTILGILNRKTFNPQISQNNWKGQISEHQAIAEPAGLGIRKPGWRGCLESAIALRIQEDIDWSKETRVSS